MSDTPNQRGQPPSYRPPQQSLGPQLIAVSSTASGNLQHTASLPMTHSPRPVLIRPTTPASAPRGVVFIRPASSIGPSTSQRIILQQLQHPQIPRQIIPSSPQQYANTILPQILAPVINSSPAAPTTISVPTTDTFEQQQDVTNAPMATLLRNAPISMRFDTEKRAHYATPLAVRHPVRPSAPQRITGPGSGLAAAARLRAQGTASPTSPTVKRTVVRELEIRVNTHPERKLSVLRYNAYDRIDLTGDAKTEGDNTASSSSSSSQSQEVFLQRENNLRQYRATHNVTDTPTRGAGSEFGQEAREEARLRRLGIVRQGYRVEDQPWLLTVGKGRTAKRYKGVREGTVSANVRHFIFCSTKDGQFDAYPVDEWYKVNPEVNYRFLRDEEAEAEYSRRHKTMNLFNVMVKRKMVSDATEEGAAELKEVNAQIKAGLASAASRKGDTGKPPSASNVKRNRSSALLLTEMDEWRDFDAGEEEEEEEDDDDDGEDDDGAKAGVGGDGGTKESSKTGDDPKNTEASGERDPKEDASGGGGGGGAGTSADGAATAAAATVSKKATKQLQQKRKRAAAIVSRKRRATKQRARRRRKGAVLGSSGEDEDDLFEEAWDESEPDDREGDEVDYITDSSSDEEKLSEDDRAQIYQEQGVDEEAGLKALLTDLSDSDEGKQKKQADGSLQDDDEDADDEGDEADDGKNGAGGSKHRRKSAKSHHRHKNRHHKPKTTGGAEDGGVSGGADDGSSSSGDDSSSEGESSSTSSSSSSDSDSDSSDSNAAPDDPGRAERKALKKAELLQRISEKVSSTIAPVEDSQQSQQPGSSKRGSVEELDVANAKRQRVEPDDALTAAVRKYLTRKPITVEELLKKIRMKKLVPVSTTTSPFVRGATGGTSSVPDEVAETMLANSLRRLRPIKEYINGKHVLSLKR